MEAGQRGRLRSARHAALARDSVARSNSRQVPCTCKKAPLLLAEVGWPDPLDLGQLGLPGTARARTPLPPTSKLPTSHPLAGRPAHNPICFGTRTAAPHPARTAGRAPAPVAQPGREGGGGDRPQHPVTQSLHREVKARRPMTMDPRAGNVVPLRDCGGGARIGHHSINARGNDLLPPHLATLATLLGARIL